MRCAWSERSSAIQFDMENEGWISVWKRSVNMWEVFLNPFVHMISRAPAHISWYTRLQNVRLNGLEVVGVWKLQTASFFCVVRSRARSRVHPKELMGLIGPNRVYPISGKIP